MRLKSLELKGFKSFANHTVINFHEDIIGIVGPNGSGKSNVIDAIRWVLGEQKSKQLRLDKMSSVIFNGSKKRKAGGLAEVSLTFENTKNLLPTEYQSVKITRILYRSGDSEYRLNNVQCRLSDITSLFLDTGIGSNSYAIIELGMVDKILNDKDNARRMMFEQAAGISKYKKRKKETLSRLKSTTENLDRVEDLLFEIEGNLKSLEKQAKRTKKYFEIKEHYKELSVLMATLKLSAHTEEYKALKVKIAEETDRFNGLETKINQLEAKIEKDKKDNLDEEQALSNTQRGLNEFLDQIRKKENEKQMLLQRISFVEQNRKKLSQQLESASNRKKQMENDITHYQSILNTEKKSEAVFEEALDEAEDALKKIKEKHQNIRQELDQIMGNQQAVEREAYELEKQKAILTNQIENLTKDIEHGQTNFQERQTKLEYHQDALKLLAKQESESQVIVGNLEKSENKRKETLLETENNLKEITQNLAKINRSLDAKQNEFQLTKSMLDNLEGFPESIQFLSKNKSWSQKVPLLSDIIYTKDEYRIAIENFLDPYLNYYVVQTTKEAHQAIDLLTNAQKGKAYFFVLEHLKKYKPVKTDFKEGIKALDVIEIDKEYQILADYLLSNVYITEQKQLDKDIDDENVIVINNTGQFIQKKYSISGGSVGLFEGKRIGRKKNLEKLEKAIKQLIKDKEKLEKSLEKTKSNIQALKSQSKEQQIRLEKEKLNKIVHERIANQTNLDSLKQIIDDFLSKNKDSESKIKELSDQIKQFGETLKDKQKIAQEAKARLENTDSSFKDIAIKMNQASQNFNEKNIEFIRQQNKVTTYQKELSFRRNQLEEIELILTQNNDTIGKEFQELQDANDKLHQLERELLEHYELKKEKVAFLNAAEQSYFKIRNAIQTLEDELRKTNRVRNESQMLLTELKDKFNQIKLELSSISERLRIEFNVDINSLMNESVPENFNEKEAQEKIDKYRRRLENYGEINPMAVEAYDEIKVRYDSIIEQRDDILKAKESLLETIKEIEETATKQFLVAFEQVKINFKEVFRSLFTEDDDCDLTLMDMENPLDSSINIVAKPKGKKPQSISQLSGGEKTLTATALLFALYLLKPAPFCIFDEVDAPLDDANIDKFNNIIKKFSGDSQFIIVTHNKQTMAAADTIYGVYMHEQGVSGVAQVDFRDLGHTSTLEIV